jgi:hypothetical protein
VSDKFKYNCSVILQAVSSGSRFARMQVTIGASTGSGAVIGVYCVFIFAEQPQAQQRPTRDTSKNPGMLRV